MNILRRDDSVLATLEQNISAAQNHLGICQQNANAAFLEAEEGQNATTKTRADNARSELSAAQARLAELTGALLSARDRQRDRDDAAKAKANAEGWKRAEKLAKERQKLGVEVETSIINLVDSYKSFVQIGIDLHAASPDPGNKLHNSMLSPVNVESYFRLQMVKAGFDFALEWPWGSDAIKPLSDKTKEGNNAALSRKVAA
jgi:hypothetical protein